ncbi:hypothetical protein CG716_04915 [Mycolicibacterium sphagni]|uniref:Uncharacterized protein n=1 Tax=Mycolicibacterium sphagni TaxID=1786 RepID=A0A255DRL4_9MYCO|nr:hypothetical protein CG716_04915 [Mycolicibacterium sphagni]
MVFFVPTTTTSHTDYTIRWIPQAVENLLHNNDIMTKAELASFLGVARSTVYKTFEDDWSGEVTTKMLAAMCSRFGVPMNRIATEPGRAAARPTRRRTAGVSVRLAG